MKISRKVCVYVYTSRCIYVSTILLWIDVRKMSSNLTWGYFAQQFLFLQIVKCKTVSSWLADDDRMKQKWLILIQRNCVTLPFLYMLSMGRLISLFIPLYAIIAYKGYITSYHDDVLRKSLDRERVCVRSEYLNATYATIMP